MINEDLIRILFVEDLPADAELAEWELRNEGLHFTSIRVETKEEFLKALEEFRPDLIISDYSMPEFDGLTALKLSLKHGPDIPFIILTGSTNEETAVDCMKVGATDYVIKERIRRLPFAVLEALEQKKARLAKEEAERALLASEEKYRNIFNNAVEGIFQATPDGRFLTANPALARLYGYGSPEELIETVTDIAKQIYVDPEQRREYSRILEEKGEVKDYELHLKRKDGTPFWISINARAVYDSMGKILFYEGLSEDITRRKEAEKKLSESLESLRKAIGTTIQVMVAAVETKDPYTAGHQKRTTDLARAIASEMGLPQDRIEGIRMAGAIHDIGKLSVPAEILSKPTKLSAIEFSLIKEHSKYGYAILKEVESPWPLADMILQHHERMDGSGYPQGLKGEDILLEARIIAVADVVEAIASFRPYRPALGIEAALEEIEKNAGVMYDKEVVVSCLRLFRERGFGFE
ncbi:MAG: HD domain-containing protein [Deltaproteobacteria bacterium]|nr:HD domain-containing protein [Deltaproteobacteria bacterium]